jgi:hypothetical protein
MNGGFEVETKMDTIQISRSGLGRDMLPGEEIILNFAMVKNPKDISVVHTATIIILAELNTEKRNQILTNVSFESINREGL